MLALVVKRGVFVTAGNSPLGSEWTFREVCSGNHLKSCDAGINSATANQVRLALHIAAFWLMHYVRSAIPQTNPLALSGRLRRKRRRSPGLPVPTFQKAGIKGLVIAEVGRRCHHQDRRRHGVEICLSASPRSNGATE